jgi:hypothetical protein
MPLCPHPTRSARSARSANLAEEGLRWSGWVQVLTSRNFLLDESQPSAARSSVARAATGHPGQRLEPACVVYLVEDLARKIHRVLHPPKSTPWGEASTSGFNYLLLHEQPRIASWAVDWCSGWCDILEDSTNFFSALLKQYDDMNDITLIQKHVDWDLHDTIVRHLLTTLTHLATWPGHEQHRNILQTFLMTLAVRINRVQEVTFAQAVADAMTYVFAIADSIVTAETYLCLLQLLQALLAHAGTGRGVGCTGKGRLGWRNSLCFDGVSLCGRSSARWRWCSAAASLCAGTRRPSPAVAS